MPATITSESSTSPVEFIMATVCKICAGPIEPLDHHLHCVACLGLAYAEAALDESDCGHCADQPARVLRALLAAEIHRIRPGDWFASVDLKDAYFHIQIAPHHRRFLRFAFEGTAYQYSVLPFGLALAPRTFSKCVDAALSPLRASGMRILNYLDDWLILAQSRGTLLSHIDSLLIHLESLGLCVNRRKSILVPSQSITYL